MGRRGVQRVTRVSRAFKEILGSCGLRGASIVYHKIARAFQWAPIRFQGIQEGDRVYWYALKPPETPLICPWDFVLPPQTLWDLLETPMSSPGSPINFLNLP